MRFPLREFSPYLLIGRDCSVANSTKFTEPYLHNLLKTIYGTLGFGLLSCNLTLNFHSLSGGTPRRYHRRRKPSRGGHGPPAYYKSLDIIQMMNHLDHERRSRILYFFFNIRVLGYVMAVFDTGASSHNPGQTF